MDNASDTWEKYRTSHNSNRELEEHDQRMIRRWEREHPRQYADIKRKIKRERLILKGRMKIYCKNCNDQIRFGSCPIGFLGTTYRYDYWHVDKNGKLVERCKCGCKYPSRWGVKQTVPRMKA